MLAYRTPGVYFERPLARPPLRRLATDVAGFVGLARSGPLHHPVKVASWPEFVAVFGGHLPQGYLAYAVEGFFANGGRTCWVVRVADPATARPAVLDLLDGATGVAAGRLTATSPGRWGRELAVTAVGTGPGRFTLVVRSGDGGVEIWRRLGLDPAGERWVGDVLGARDGGSRLLRLCPAAGPPAAAALPVVEGRAEVRRPAGGADGLATLTVEHFLGRGAMFSPYDPCAAVAKSDRPWGLAALEEVDEVSLVAIPDAVSRPPSEVLTRPRPPRCDRLPEEGEAEPPPPIPEEPPEWPPVFGTAEVSRLQHAMVAHCTQLRDRVALLDVPPATAGGGDEPQQLAPWRQGFTSRWAAAYFPWLAVPEPLPTVARATGSLLVPVPPSGHVAGLIAASDLRVGVHKPPANERLAGVEDVAFPVDDIAHGDLNETGINVLRPYPGRGIRLMGARTLDLEPAQRYLNVRRLLIAIAETLDEQLQWTVFEPNDRNLWQQIDRVVRALLLGMWRDGMLDGAKERDAFTVRCDETTNPPEAQAQGRMVCEIGVKAPWPAEFVVARIGIAEGGVELIDETTAAAEVDRG